VIAAFALPTAPHGQPAFILQTFGDLVTFHPCAGAAAAVTAPRHGEVYHCDADSCRNRLAIPLTFCIPAMETESRSQPHPVYDFGEFRLDASRRLLFAKGANETLPVTPKMIAALLLFIENRGELLTKDQFMAGLWPGRVVEENNLTQLISVLRHVLGEEPGENRYIATVPGIGYRFIADVSRHVDAAEPPVNPQEIAPTDHARSRRMAVVAMTGALGAVLLTYGWYAHWRPADETPASPPPAIELPSRTIAVLPFENLSADDGNEYIAFGVAESVLHRLAHVPNLTVIARTSSFVFRDRATDARDIGRALNARYLLEGSLQHSDERVRVTAQLIDATTGGHVWSLRFDRTLADMFSVEDEIAQGVAQALQVSLDQPEHPYARFGIDAYLSYLQGQALIATHRSDDAERAIEHFRRAIEIAPNFGAGQAALADAMWQVLLKVQTAGMGELHRARTARHQQLLEAGVREVQPVLERALELDDKLAEAYILRADLKNVMDDPVGAEADYRKGLSLRPNYSKGHVHFSVFLYSNGSEEETLAEIDRAILLDPLMPRAYYVKGYYEVFTEAEEGGTAIEGERYVQQALARAPDYHPALLLLGRIRWYQGRFAEAAMLAERALAVDPRVEWTRRVLAEIYLDIGELAASRSVLLEAPATVPPIYWLATCLYEQRLEQAAELLRADPARDGFIDEDTPAYVLRDAARASGHPEHGRTELLKRGPDPYGLHRGPEPYALMTVAHLNFVLGDRAESERNARRLLEPDYGPYGFNRRIFAVPKAAALTLLGEHDAAIDLLEDHGRLGFGWRWWYTFDREPVFDALRADPRFQALAAKAHAHADAERERLGTMRERGQVPTRLADGTPGPQGC